MPELFLLRHADAANEAADDHERSLSTRGVAEADAIGERLRSTGAAVTLVLCSSALRTRETLAALREVGALGAAPGGAEPEARIEDGLYLASARAMLGRLQEIPLATKCALLIGHNPGIHELAIALAGEGDRDAYDQLRSGMPPAALCRLDFEGDWDDLGPGVARLVAHNFPE